VSSTVSAISARTISSVFSLVLKVVVPLWIVLFGVPTVLLWLNMMHGAAGGPVHEGITWFFLILWIAGSVFFFLVPMRLKRVRIGENGLYISNYIREISVPFDSIKDVTFNRWIRGNPITVHFRDATAFGDRIMFLPRPDFDFRNWNKPHPVIAELRRLAGLKD